MTYRHIVDENEIDDMISIGSCQLCSSVCVPSECCCMVWLKIDCSLNTAAAATATASFPPTNIRALNRNINLFDLCNAHSHKNYIYERHHLIELLACH